MQLHYSLPALRQSTKLWGYTARGCGLCRWSGGRYSNCQQMERPHEPAKKAPQSYYYAHVNSPGPGERATILWIFVWISTITSKLIQLESIGWRVLLSI